MSAPQSLFQFLRLKPTEDCSLMPDALHLTEDDWSFVMEVVECAVKVVSHWERGKLPSGSLQAQAAWQAEAEPTMQALADAVKEIQ